MDTAVLRAGAPDLLAAAFYQLGYRPRESLVLVGLAGPRHRIGLVVRCDLPALRDVRAAVDPALPLLAREGADALAVLVVSDAAPRPAPPGRPPGPLDGWPHRTLARRAVRRAEDAGFRVLDVIAVGDARFRSYRCTDAGCCPAAGRDLAEVFASRVATAYVLRGRALAADESALLADVEPSAPEPAPDLAAGPPLPAAEALRRWRALLAAAAPGAEVPAADVAWLPDALADVRLRDAVLLTLVPGSGLVPEEVAAGRAGAVLDRVLEAAPDLELLGRGCRLLAAAARHAPAGRRADVLALLAWGAWWSGDGVRGRLLAARALADRPGHRLAVLLDRLLLFGVPPEWLRRPARRGGRDCSDRVEGSSEPSGS